MNTEENKDTIRYKTKVAVREFMTKNEVFWSTELFDTISYQMGVDRRHVGVAIKDLIKLGEIMPCDRKKGITQYIRVDK